MPPVGTDIARGGGGGVMVTGYGGLPWTRSLASALAQAGMLESYLCPIAPTPRVERVLVRVRPASVRRWLEAQVAMRPVPEGVDPDLVRLVATSGGLATGLAGRLRAPAPVVRTLHHGSQRLFDARAASVLSGSDASVVTLFLGAALKTLDVARRRGVITVLDYPIAHHAFSETLLGEEARLRPEFAETLQFHHLRSRQRTRLDAEIERADRIVMLCSFHRRTFVQAGVPEEKLITVPLGVDLDLFTPEPRTEGDGTFRVLFAGQIGQRKGLSYLLDGFEAAALGDAELTLLGRPVGPTRIWDRRDRVRHMPAVRFTELPGVYRGADVFVLPSLVEAFPQTALQAMACGLPVIVSEHTFADDVVEDGVSGFIVPIRDAGAISERLEYLREHSEERLRIGAQARKRAESFSWKQYGDRSVRALGALRRS